MDRKILKSVIAMKQRLASRKKWMNAIQNKIISVSRLYYSIMVDILGEVVGSLVGQNPGVAISADQ